MKKVLIILGLLLTANYAIAIPNEHNVRGDYWIKVKTADKPLTIAQKLNLLNKLIPEEQTEEFDTHLLRAELYLKLNSPQTALKWLNVAASSRIDRISKIEVYNKQADIYIKLKNYDKAFECYEIINSEKGYERLYNIKETPLNIKVKSCLNLATKYKNEGYKIVLAPYLNIIKVISHADANDKYFTDTGKTKQENLLELKDICNQKLENTKYKNFSNGLYEYALGNRSKAVNMLIQERKEILKSVGNNQIMQEYVNDFLTGILKQIDSTARFVFTKDEMSITFQ